MTKEGSTRIINFMTPAAGVLVLGRGHISHIVKLHYSFKHFLLYSQALIRQSKYVVMMTKEGSTEIINIMTPGAEFIQMSRTTLNIAFCDSMFKKFNLCPFSHLSSTRV